MFQGFECLGYMVKVQGDNTFAWTSVYFFKGHCVLLWKHMDKELLPERCGIELHVNVQHFHHFTCSWKWKEGEFSYSVLLPRWVAAAYNPSKDSRSNNFEMYFCHWTIMWLKWTSGISYYLTQKITVGFCVQLQFFIIFAVIWKRKAKFETVFSVTLIATHSESLLLLGTIILFCCKDIWFLSSSV